MCDADQLPNIDAEDLVMMTMIMMVTEWLSDVHMQEIWIWPV